MAGSQWEERSGSRRGCFQTEEVEYAKPETRSWAPSAK
jgi:hypothetical protein